MIKNTFSPIQNVIKDFGNNITKFYHMNYLYISISLSNKFNNKSSTYSTSINMTFLTIMSCILIFT